MLLILSEEYDGSTNDVIDWLRYFKIPFIRIHNSSRIQLKNTSINSEKISWNITAYEQFYTTPININFDEITGFWYRRGQLVFNTQPILAGSSPTRQLSSYYLQKYVTDQEEDILKFLYNSLKRKKHLGYFYDNFTVKLHNLSVAINCGLIIPDTVIVSNKLDLITFKNKHTQCIVKGIQHNSFIIPDLLDVSCGTEIITEENLTNIPEIFTPSLVQQYIEKLFELRVFYIEGKCYSAAIFSQEDEKTKIDFRNYNRERPNRLVPYQLPLDIENKLTKFMNTLDMKTGSIDLILTTQLEYIFLEVNPVGQFGWISTACSYNLEKIVANYFKN